MTLLMMYCMKLYRSMWSSLGLMLNGSDLLDYLVPVDGGVGFMCRLDCII